MPNRLAASTSPYLRQHAGNPVDWYEWGEEAFAAARARDVPILLSVGYSACHWCHVMAHESFEDPETAALMNELFVNVKVDREERPDVDSVYMEAVQALTGRGGWPMTVWLTPDGRPFYAGTYFPKTDRHGMPAFHRIMEAVTEAWRERRHELGSQADRVTDAISRTIPAAEAIPTAEDLATGYRLLERQYDPVEGGFGDAPKFPQQPVLEFLLRVHRETWAPKAGAMVRQTLRKIARGGIRDHVGGGFARYSVDRLWLVPHFEKMLYDNAQLARLYLRAWQELGEDDFLGVALETLEYLKRDLRHEGGAFFSAEDADSEGEEGRFYVWDEDEVRRVTGEDAEVAVRAFGVTPEGNFEGRNVLHEALSVAEVAEMLGLPEDEVADRLERAKTALFTARAGRVRPGPDHKIVASWNGLALRAFAEAGAVLDREDLLSDARSCARFLLDELVDGDRVLRSWSEGEAKVAGFLEDHASLAVGLFTLYAATGELEWYEGAERLARAVPARFTDPAGGFFTTSGDAEALVKRPKDQMDNPLPSGNSLAAEALLLLSLYTGESAMREAAESAIRAGGAVVERHPTAVGHLMGVTWSIHDGLKEVAVTGPDARMLAEPVWERFLPGVALAVDETGEGADAVPLLHGRWQDGKTLAYVCEGFVCAAPTSDAAHLRAQLGR